MMSKAAFKIDMTVDASGFTENIRKLDWSLQNKFLKQILRDVAKKVQVSALKAAAPRGETGNLSRSMGTITGKSSQVATIFAGPRMSTGGLRKGASKFQKGWVANILENAKSGRRYPVKSKVMRVYFKGQGPYFFKSVGPIKKKTKFKSVLKGLTGRTTREVASSVTKVIKKNWHAINV